MEDLGQPVVDLERVAHGGFVVGRADGKVVFVTGGLPGERVRVELTEVGRRFDRGRVVEVLEPAPGRVLPPCPIADECGGCDWQHASVATQLELKTAVVAEQLQRLAGIQWDGTVQPIGGPWGSRTRMRYAVRGDGAVGLRARRSHDVVPLPEQGCLVATPGPSPRELESLGARDELVVVQSDDGTTILADGVRVAGADPVHETVGARRFEVAAGGFWQVHPGAATVLTEAVLRGLAPAPGESALDLYCGVGLFAGALVDAGCGVLGVEQNRDAVALARRNVPEARFFAGSLERALGRLPRRVDLVVLDPPRKGAGRDVVRHLSGLDARAVAYVACDPAALARDLSYFADAGYRPVSIEAFDLFPMTHHVECVAILHPAGPEPLR